MRQVFLACVLAGTLFFAAVPALANDTAVGGAGGTVVPMTGDGVRLEAETVQVILHRRFASYRIDFLFRNEGPAQTLKLGFPFPQGSDGAPHVPPASVRAWSDGTSLPVTRDTGTDNGTDVEWWLHDVTFEAGATHVRVEYYAAPTLSPGTPGSLSLPEGMTSLDVETAVFPYTVHTGAGWAGTIGKSIIRYELSGDFEGWGAPELLRERTDVLAQNGQSEHARVLGSFTNPEPMVYQWVFEDFEPTYSTVDGSPYDIGLRFAMPIRRSAHPNPSFGGAQEPYPGFVSSSSWLDLDTYTYPPDCIYDGYPSSAWAEGAEDSGEGEWVRIPFAGSRAVREVQILPGYAKSTSLFEKYNRPRTLDVEFSDGTRTTLSLRDEPVLQTFPVSANAEWARVTIQDVYRGTTRDETYISEIEFSEASTPEFATFEDLMGLPPARSSTAGPAEESTLAAAPVSTPRAASHTGADADEGAPPRMPVWALPGLALVCAAAAVLLWYRRRRSTVAV